MVIIVLNVQAYYSVFYHLVGGDFIFRYVTFLIRCYQQKFNFFAASPLEKASHLAEDHLAFWAGLYYMDAKEYPLAASCFEGTKAYKHLIVSYEKQGLYSKAIALADEKKYYELGAKICLRINDLKQAAYFYSHFNPSHAAKLYRDLDCYYEAGYCYLSLSDALGAIDMFRRCTDGQQKVDGLQQVSDYALVLYFKRSYETAFKIFIALDNFYSALECAIHMKEKDLIQSCRYLIAEEEAKKQHYQFAAQCIEAFDPLKAMSYYAQSGNYQKQVHILLDQNEHEKAIQVCLLHQDLNQAYQIAARYNPTLLSS